MNTERRDPKHLVVRTLLEKRVAEQFAPGDRLPPERILAEELGVNRTTVRRALDEMERAGLIHRVQGAGTFVSENRIRKTLELTSFSADMRARGRQPGAREITITHETAGMTVGYALELSPADEVLHIRRVRTADKEPICLESSYIPAALTPDLADGLQLDSLYEDLEHRFGLVATSADQSIRAVVLDPDEAALLDVPAYSPAIMVLRTTRDARGNAFEYAVSRYRADLYSFDITVSRARSGD